MQELVEKAPVLPSDIRWHFIGHLQSNKVKMVIEGVPNLAMLETVDTEKLASKLDSAVQSLGRLPLAVMIQVCGQRRQCYFVPCWFVPCWGESSRGCVRAPASIAGQQSR